LKISASSEVDTVPVSKQVWSFF